MLHSYDPKQDFGASNRGDFRDAGLDKLIESAVFGLDASHEDKLKAARASPSRRAWTSSSSLPTRGRSEAASRQPVAAWSLRPCNTLTISSGSARRVKSPFTKA